MCSRSPYPRSSSHPCLCSSASAAACPSERTPRAEAPCSAVLLMDAAVPHQGIATQPCKKRSSQILGPFTLHKTRMSPAYHGSLKSLPNSSWFSIYPISVESQLACHWDAHIALQDRETSSFLCLLSQIQQSLGLAPVLCHPSFTPAGAFFLSSPGKSLRRATAEVDQSLVPSTARGFGELLRCQPWHSSRWPGRSRDLTPAPQLCQKLLRAWLLLLPKLWLMAPAVEIHVPPSLPPAFAGPPHYVSHAVGLVYNSVQQAAELDCGR